MAIVDLSSATERFRDNTRVANSLANKSVTLRFRDVITGAVVANTTRVTDSVGSIGSFSVVALSASTTYRMHYLFEDGEYGVLKVSTEA